MAKRKVTLQDLLSYKDSETSWFSLDEHLPHALVKRNLKLLRGLNSTSTTTLEELDQLTKQEMKDAVSAYTARLKQNVHPSVIPTTAPQFFHSRMNQSSYFCDIISYSERIPHRATQSRDTALSPSTKETHHAATDQVHGFHLKEGEAFSSTRYFSEDKKSYAKIIVKNGTFTATSKNLNDAQEIDLALEMSYQYLLNLPPEKKEININGSPKDVHRLHAALLYLQKEAGARFADLTFKLPDGMSITPKEVNEDYITKHLGTFKEPPQQIVQWRDFLSMERNTPKKDAQKLPQLTPEAFVDEPTKSGISPQEERVPLIDMGRVFKSNELSQQDKMHLNEYQRYVKDVWVDGIKALKERAGDTEYKIAAHEEFMQRTESALRIFKKAPLLEKEFEALKIIYTQTMETHQEMLESLHQNDIDYETRMKELLPQLKKAQRAALEECSHCVSEHLEAEFERTPLSEKELHTNLRSHLQSMEEIRSFIQDKKELSEEMLRSFGAQMVHALNCLESIKDYYKSPLFQQMKDFSQEQSETKSRITKTESERLLHASSHVKQRLNQFKSELQAPTDSEVALSTELKEQLGSLAIKINRFVEGLGEGDVNNVLNTLAKQAEKMSINAKAGLTELAPLRQMLEESLPHIENNCGLLKAFTELNKQMNASIEPMPISNENHTSQGLNM